MTFKPKWIVACIAAYLLFLIASMPAAQALRFATLPASVKIGAVSGTIWNGKAQFVQAKGIPVENVSWQLSPWRLLIGSLHADIDAGNARDAEQVSVNGPVSLSVFNPSRIAASDLTLFLPSDLVIANLPLPVPVNAQGRFKLDIQTLDFDKACRAIEGKGQWLNAGIEGLGQPLSLGTFNADIGCEDGVTLLEVKEPNLFGLSAVARIPENMKVSVLGRFKPDDSLPKAVKDAAGFFGQADAQGYYPIDF